jgi:hypothetical protein
MDAAKDRYASRHVCQLADGATVHVSDHELKVQDAAGRVLVRYCDGVAEVVSHGDLRLSAPAGRVQIEAAEGVSVKAPQVEIEAGESTLRLNDEETALSSRRVKLVSGVASVVARHLSSSAIDVVSKAERWELEADRIVERSRDVFREVEELVQLRAGRVRQFVQELYHLKSGQTALHSDEETRVDGKKILLG